MEGDHLVDLDTDGKIRLKWIFKTCDGETCIGLICPMIGTGAGSCEHSNKQSGSTEC